ncbi:MAG: type II secretion system F family protein [Alphaproteobacteria bacterium]
MVIDELHLLSATVFATVLLLVVGVHRLYVDSTAGRRTAIRRLQSHAERSVLRDNAETLRRKPHDRISLLARFDGWLIWLEGLVREAGFSVSVRRILLLMGGVTGLIFAGAMAAINSIGPAGVVVMAFAAFGIGVAVTIAVLVYLRARRIARFAAQLPEALDIMVRSLRAGHPVGAALGMVTRELPEPMGAEFGIAVDEMTYGLDLREALANLAQRMAVPDLQYVTIAIGIQHETGGNLAEVLQGLNTVIRARCRMLKKIQAVSAEGRLSSHVLAALPLVFAGLVFVSRPNFYLAVIDDPLFFPIVGAAVGLELAGIYIMHRLVNFRV